MKSHLLRFPDHASITRLQRPKTFLNVSGKKTAGKKKWTGMEKLYTKEYIKQFLIADLLRDKTSSMRK